MYRLAFLSSGEGFITRTVIDAINQKVIKGVKPICIVSDRKSDSLNLASLFSGRSFLIDYSKIQNRRKFSDQILNILITNKIDLVFLTFDRLLSGKILKKYKNKMINIHPSLLPAFPGYNTVGNALKYGSKFVGATCHLIDSGEDSGPIINQGVLPIETLGKEADVRQKLYKLRQKIALEALKSYVSNKIQLNGRLITIKGANYKSYPINPTINDVRINKFLDRYGK